MPAERVVAALDDDLTATAVRLDESRAAKLGVRAVPTFVFGRRFAVSGAQPVGRARRRRPPRPHGSLTRRAAPASAAASRRPAIGSSIVARGARTYHWTVREPRIGRRQRTVRSGPSTLPLEGGSRRASARTGTEEAA